MSAAEAWSLAIAVVILAAAVAFLYWIWRTGDRCKGRPYMRARIVRGSNVRPEPDVRDASETKPGTDVAVQDALELLYSMPAYGETTTDHTTTEGDL